MRYALAASLVAAAFIATPTPDPVTAEDVIARHVAAIGGEERLNSVKHRTKSTTMVMYTKAGEFTIEATTYYSAPDLVLATSKSSLFGDSSLGFDGSMAWQRTARSGAKELVGDQVAAVRVAPRAPSWAGVKGLRLLGRRSFEGRPTWAIGYTADTMGVVAEHFDAETWLRLATEVDRPATGKRATLLYEDYQVRDGYTIAMREVLRMGSDTVSIKTITRLDHTPIPASTYAAPAELVRKSP